MDKAQTTSQQRIFELLEKEPRSRQDLVLLTGYNDRTIREDIKKLTENGVNIVFDRDSKQYKITDNLTEIINYLTFIESYVETIEKTYRKMNDFVEEKRRKYGTVD